MKMAICIKKKILGFDIPKMRETEGKMSSGFALESLTDA
jgi:hypothetical protein